MLLPDILLGNRFSDSFTEGPMQLALLRTKGQPFITERINVLYGLFNSCQ